MPAVWPSGSAFVLLDRGPVQINLPSSVRGLERHYRIGAANRGYDDPSTVHLVQAFDGIGLRPYRPVHLRVAAAAGGDLTLRWTRRTRIDGDAWRAVDVPLGEDRERYVVQVVVGAEVIREAVVERADFAYSASQQATDGTLGGGYRMRVAQLSDRFGPGPFAEIVV